MTPRAEQNKSEAASASAARVAIVTGHSRGLGAAMAEHLLARGIPVLGISRRGNPDLVERFPALIEEVALDLSDATALLVWIETGALERFYHGQHTALLINNAGLLQPVGPLESQDPAAVSRAATVNVGAVLTLSAAFVRATAHIRSRRLLHISSGAGSKAYAGWSVYCATKAALDHHARAVSMDNTRALRICSLAPGIVDTDMQAEIRSSTDELFPDRQRFVKMKREGQLHSPDETGALVVGYLLSDEFGREPVVDLRRRLAST